MCIISAGPQMSWTFQLPGRSKAPRKNRENSRRHCSSATEALFLLPRHRASATHALILLHGHCVSASQALGAQMGQIVDICSGVSESYYLCRYAGLSQRQMRRLACPRSIKNIMNGNPVARSGLILGEDEAMASGKLFKHLLSPAGPVSVPKQPPK